jgi:predicted peroxiredoxin
MVDACRIHPIIQEFQTMMKSLKALAVVAVMSVTAIAPMAVHAGDQHMIDEVLVILSSESLQTQGMAMVLSNTMAQKGAKVNVLLCDKAGDLALKTYDAPALKPKDVTPGQMLRGLLKQGGTANVCALYLPNSDYSKDDLLSGVGVATPPEMAEQMLNSEMRTFTF